MADGFVPAHHQAGLPLDRLVLREEPGEERIDLDVVFVGAGPAGLAGAIELARLVQRDNAGGDGVGDVQIGVLEKAGALGEHVDRDLGVLALAGGTALTAEERAGIAVLFAGFLRLLFGVLGDPFPFLIDLAHDGRHQAAVDRNHVEEVLDTAADDLKSIDPVRVSLGSGGRYGLVGTSSPTFVTSGTQRLFAVANDGQNEIVAWGFGVRWRGGRSWQRGPYAELMTGRYRTRTELKQEGQDRVGETYSRETGWGAAGGWLLRAGPAFALDIGITLHEFREDYFINRWIGLRTLAVLTFGGDR